MYNLLHRLAGGLLETSRCHELRWKDSILRTESVLWCLRINSTPPPELVILEVCSLLNCSKMRMCVCVSMCMCKCVYVCIICVCVCVCAMYVMCVYVYVYVYVICVMCICDMCICRHMWMCVMCVWVCMLCLYVFMCKWMQVTQVPEEGRAVASSGAGVIDRCLWVARCGHLELTWALWYLSKLLIAEPSFLLHY